MVIRLGLIGDNIEKSQAPDLHRLAGQSLGQDVTYDRLVPWQLEQSFDQIFDSCVATGFRGINVTYPYKELAVPRVQIDDPQVRAIGAINTVVFDAGGPRGYNTDYSGFIEAYKRAMTDKDTGPVTLIGSGGVGRAIAFGLATLGTKDLRLVDLDAAKSTAVAEALRAVNSEMTVSVWTDAAAAAQGAAGLINCTPVGMVGYEGTPLERAAMTGAKWAFDAVYTPVDTEFLNDAKSLGLTIISGWELFFFQGLHAWKIFSGTACDEVALRQNLMQIGGS